jgi:hypothetical protein
MSLLIGGAQLWFSQSQLEPSSDAEGIETMSDPSPNKHGHANGEWGSEVSEKSVFTSPFVRACRPFPPNLGCRIGVKMAIMGFGFIALELQRGIGVVLGLRGSKSSTWEEVPSR